MSTPGRDIRRANTLGTRGAIRVFPDPKDTDRSYAPNCRLIPPSCSLPWPIMAERTSEAASVRPRTERMGGVGAVLSEQLEKARRAGEESKSVILVEGVSDERAIVALARRRGRDLTSEGTAIIAIAGATNARRFMRILGPDGFGIRLTGLCDQGEVGMFRKALEEAGLSPGRTRSDMERIGFYVCVRDLEDELIRALGVDSVMAIIEADGRLRSFRSFRNQPAQRKKAIEDQLWRWMGNRKIRYARLLVDALDLERVPSPLDRLLAHG